MDDDLKFPCDYCGTLLNEDGEERSDIPAAGPRHWHSADGCRQRVSARLEYARERSAKLWERLASAEAALRAIAESPHCEYSHDGTSCGHGHADGRRCAAQTARAYFEANRAPRKETP